MFGKRERKEPTEKQKIGKIGEDYACDYLTKNGYTNVCRNYLRKWGEIDIVVRKGKLLHFVEVKSVTHVTSGAVSGDIYRPEDNMHPWKLQRLGRAIQSYLLEKDISDDIDWQFDVVTVYLDREGRLLKVSVLEDVVL
ncbi:MAG: hypothetical protein A2566_03060 [Candidatus Zambryskibacteria bacterium RIFOXYD1_FULL_40_13]|nr:MAG: hypothetical protein UT25_C0002G0074 [Parcubacteria group bacterium GW2011_GWC1_39_12]KKR19427.1 MAG: hypothetical protein UT49_C0002G0273 [Parcubacteria group bacterium GW2011_GWF1_39_37]KKR35053.1 MAG: hypothetical protein UT68_C0005G0002 [Parcubacteria group bacterium GW2011_GWC2_40_10]KKR52376.1 MAG: hypothetical protein UT89_C0002G0177 [Parcubacteria group bacterium GW2011_GWE1_40_20]KKR65464.1 MAG: hypothetical protein UU06_C0018G0007 [Parcubacteria group bacterium GW2011_GWB1_40_